MIRKKSEIKTTYAEKLRGGVGTLETVHFIDPKELKHCRLFTEMTFPPGASIGNHPHENEAEYYYIIKGSATMIEDGKESAISAGDCSICDHGHSHSIINTGSEPLVLLAAIITY